DHVEGEAVLVRAAGAKALDLAIDDAGVDLLDRVIAEPEALDRAGRHVFDRDIGLFQQGAYDLQTARRFEVQRQRLLVGVELVEIPGVVVGLAGAQAAARIAGRGVFYFAHPGPAVVGFSILPPPGPSQARDSVQDGPASNWVKSTTLTPWRQSSSTPISAIAHSSRQIFREGGGAPLRVVISPWRALRAAKVELSNDVRRDGPHVEGDRNF